MPIDYNILIKKRVDLNSNINIDEQILQIAIYDEFKAYETYSKIIETFGNINPFINIKESEAVHYSMLIKLAEKYSVEVPINDWKDKIEIPNNIIECYELGVAAEIENIAMYNNLLINSTKSDITDALFRLQAASFNNHLPAFRSCVINYYNSFHSSSNSSEDIMQKMQEYQEIVNNLMSGDIDENTISNLSSKLFSNISFQFLGGAVSGAAIVALLNQFLENQNSNKE
ncbi:ferritin-like domain-containing protein [Aliarcobacter cryaerophilus]|uniref:ferritin-like domain-containing protein n=1 Tax=Aliarcobacter cryaerophilus TaxID=28198 RepID=UPI003DA6997C